MSNWIKLEDGAYVNMGKVRYVYKKDGDLRLSNGNGNYFTTGINNMKIVEKHIMGNNNKEKNMLTELKDWFKENKSMIFNVVFILIVDHLFLDGSLRHKVKDVLGGVLDKEKGKNDVVTIK